VISEMDLALSNLKRLRHFRNWLIWGFLPGVLLISNLVGRVTHLAYSFFIVCALWMIGIAYSVRRVRLWPCPNCGKPIMQGLVSQRFLVQMFALRLLSQNVVP
jgi:hypothetical protein